MIVPFLFGAEKNPIHYLWIFYKYMEFALENDYPVIAEEAYFEKPSIYEKGGGYPFKDVINGYNYKHEFIKPTDEMMKRLKKVKILDSEKNGLLKKHKTIENLQLNIIKQRDKEFEKIIDKKIEEVEKKYGKIQIMITWTWYPSLEFCCKKKKIELLYLEQTTFRPDTYRIKLGYFQFYDKYNNDKMDESYEEFMSQNKNQTFFNRKELLSLFLSKENLHIIKQMEEPPQYEFGVSIGPDWDPLAQGHCQMNEKRILTKLKEIVKKENISLRTHPAGRKKTEELEGYALDHSKDALEWIIKNKRIASIGSNVNFETMLVGRTAYNLGNNFPYRKGSVCTLDQLEEKVCDISYLNFIIFGYYAPYDLMFNKDYILWRLSNPSITEIYEYNLKHIITNSMKLNESFLKMPVCDRLEFILKEYQKLEPTEIDNLLNHPVIDKDQVIKTLEQELEQSKNEYEKIIHSKSWKITKPLRWITNRIK